MKDKPLISVIMPVYNSLEHLKKTLPAIKGSSYKNYELIIVDDNSDDSTPLFAKKYADILIELDKNVAPGKARNEGVKKSNGSILLFIDSDVEVKSNTLSMVADGFNGNGKISALFGSYDDEPFHKDFFSQYKNLAHHYFHQTADEEATTFWSGCGAILKNTFLKAGGFPEYYSAPAIEDVELGYKLSENGHKIKINKLLQVTHLKRWDFFSLVKTDIKYRALPWTKLAFTSGLPNDLNFKTSDRLSGFIAVFFFMSLPLIWFQPLISVLSSILFIIFLFLNRKIISFFYKMRGLLFMIKSVFFHLFYYLYSSLAFGILYTYYMLKRPDEE